MLASIRSTLLAVAGLVLVLACANDSDQGSDIQGRKCPAGLHCMTAVHTTYLRASAVRMIADLQFKDHEKCLLPIGSVLQVSGLVDVPRKPGEGPKIVEATGLNASRVHVKGGGNCNAFLKKWRPFVYFPDFRGAPKPKTRSDEDGPLSQFAGKFGWPLDAPNVTAPFGQKRPTHIHAGLDIVVSGANTFGKPVKASESGIFRRISDPGGYGMAGYIFHPVDSRGRAFSTRYGHFNDYQKADQAKVGKGHVIGLAGCTGRCEGPHVHFEIRIDGVPVNPVFYLGKSN